MDWWLMLYAFGGRGRIYALATGDYWAANLLIERHGNDAVVEAGRLLDLMLDRGDMKGRQVWLRVRRAIVQLQAVQTGPIQ
jgi:hypothetical protein